MSFTRTVLSFAPLAALARWLEPASAKNVAPRMFYSPRHFLQARFLHKAELVLLRQLRKALPGCEVFTQVALGALVQPPSDWPDELRQASWRKYQGSIVDFVVWDPVQEQVLCLLELQSRDPAELKKRDILRDAITGEAGYPLVRLHKGENFSEELLRERIFDAIDHPPNPTVWAKERSLREALARDGIELS
jgi:hypothetical protein